MSKKKYIIVAIIIVILLVLAIIFTLINKKQSGIRFAAGKAKKLISGSIIWPTLSLNGQTIYYFDNSSNLFKQYQVQPGSDKNLFDKAFQNVSTVSWSPKKDKVIIQTSQQNGETDYKITNYYLDFSSKEQKEIGLSSSTNFIWSTNQDKIAYISPTNDNLDNITINLSDPDGKNSQKLTEITSFGAPVELFWTQNNLVVFKPFYNPPETFLSDEDQQAKLYYIDVKSQKIKSASISPDASDIKFSPDGQTMIMIKSESDNTFEIIKPSGKHTISQTIDSLSSIAFSQDNKYLYNFVNQSQNSNNSISICQINLSDYSIQKLSSFALEKNSAMVYFIDNLMKYPDQNIFFFTNQNNLFGFKVQ